MALNNNFFIAANGNSINLDLIDRAEIHIFRQEGINHHALINARIKYVQTPFKENVDLSDIQIIEDYFIDKNIDYSTIIRN